jgi:hypothetical protein
MAFVENTNTFITMADGTKKLIETIQSGDWVLNSDGFPVHVRGVSHINSKDDTRALVINGEITVSINQVFIGEDGLYYVYKGLQNRIYRLMSAEAFCSVSYDSIVSNQPLVGLDDSIVRELTIGSRIMKTTGPVEVTSIEIIDPFTINPPTKKFQDDLYSKPLSEIDIDTLNIYDYVPRNTKLISHILGQKSTYIVNDYKCLAVPVNEWDYKNDVRIDPSTFTVKYDQTNNRFIRVFN